MPRSLVLGLLALLLPLRILAHGDPHGTLPSDAATPGGFMTNFRLTDHLGTTRELFYESTAKAIVLVFTGTGHPRAVQTASALRELRTRYPAGDVVIWQIDSSLGADRGEIAAEQLANSNDTPVLLDYAQLVAGEYIVSHQLETFVVNAANRILVYRGPLDNADPGTTAAPTENYASDALATLLAGTAIATPLRAMPTGARPVRLPPAAIPDYARDVAPIVDRSCRQCHSPGNIGAFVFSSYDDLLLRAGQIRSDLLTRRMTPWHADVQHGVFSNSTALTPTEIATLFTWTRAGAPRGTGADPLPAAAPPAGGDWPLGPPDLVVGIPVQNLPATGILDYRYLTVNVPLATDRWLRAAVVKPGNTAVVHHALVFEGGLLDVLTNAGGLGGFFAGYVPGLQQTWFPDGSGKLLHRNAQVTFQMHYTTTGRAETDQTQIGFYFAATQPERELKTRSAYTTDITIPAHAREYEREATFTPSATSDVMLYELNPHMHYRGKRFKYEALYPDGSSEVLLNVPHYDFHWQSQYRLSPPKRLPAGTVIRARGAFDNSTRNSANPNANVTVTFGEQTNDEMFVGYINYAEMANAAAPAPVFPGNRAAHGRVGEPFSLTPAATNSVNLYRAAAALPAGLSLDAATGAIAGTPQSAGRTALVIYADNGSGSAATIVDLTISAALTAPVVTAQPVAQARAAGETATFAVAANGATPISYQWFFNGLAIQGATNATLSIAPVGVAHAGQYWARLTNALGTTTSQPAILGVTATTKVTGAGTEVGPNIVHANGNTYDQVLLEGTAVAVTADPGQVVRVSYVDLSDDIVQIEYSGAGTLTLTLDGATGPAAPVNYNQPTVTYMKGHAGITITGADETTNVSVFSVGRANAFNQALFRSEVNYDGFADIAFLAITSVNGKFGGVRTANASYWAARGLTGVYAPGVQFEGPVYVGDINASDTAAPQLVLGAGATVQINGGDLLQANAQPVRVSGIAQLRFVAGSSSHGNLIAAQSNRARLEQDGTDVTAQIVVNPAP